MNEKLENILSWMNTAVAPDKLKHFFWGYLIFKISSIFVGSFLGLFIVLVIAMYKEGRDRKSPGHESSLLDIIYTISPAVIDVTFDILKLG